MNGQGFRGAANLTGLSSRYIIQQVQEFRSGRRRSWQHDRLDTEEMIKVSKAVTDADLARGGPDVAPMRAPTAGLSKADITDVAA